MYNFPGIQEGYNRRFSHFTSRLSQPIISRLVDPLLKTTLFAGPEQINEAIGKAVFVDRDILRNFRGGMQTLTDEMGRRYRDRIFFEHPVTRIERAGKKYGITTPSLNEEFDYVISTIPLSLLPCIFPEYSNKLKYSSAKKLLVIGDVWPYYNKVDTLFIGEGNSGIHKISRKGKRMYKVSVHSDEPMLKSFFKYADIVNEQTWTEALPLVTSDIILPSPVTPYRGFYLAGDYALPCMEMSVDTGYKTAKHIMRE